MLNIKLSARKFSALACRFAAIVTGFVLVSCTSPPAYPPIGEMENASAIAKIGLSLHETETPSRLSPDFCRLKVLGVKKVSGGLYLYVSATFVNKIDAEAVSKLVISHWKRQSRPFLTIVDKNDNVARDAKPGYFVKAPYGALVQPVDPPFGTENEHGTDQYFVVFVLPFQTASYKLEHCSLIIPHELILHFRPVPQPTCLKRTELVKVSPNFFEPVDEFK